MTARDQVRRNKTAAQVNRNVSNVALVERVPQLTDPRASTATVLEELAPLFQTNPTRKSAGRKFERKKLKHAQKLRYHRYTKRVVA